MKVLNEEEAKNNYAKMQAIEKRKEVKYRGTCPDCKAIVECSEKELYVKESIVYGYDDG